MKISEFIKLIPAGLKNADKIVKALYNQVRMEFNTLPEEYVEVITERRIICSTCPFNSINATNSGIYINKNRTDEHCIHCLCPISTRTAALDMNCGLDVFNAKNPDHKIPLKWEKIKTEKDATEN